MKHEFSYTDLALHRLPEIWNSIRPQSNIAQAIEEAWKVKAGFLDQVSRQNNVVVFLSNPFTNRFIYMSDKLKVLSDIDPALYLAENGVEFSLSRLHPGQFDAVVKFSQLGFAYMAENKRGDCNSIILNLNYLYRNGNNEYMQVLQRGMILETDSNGMPALFVSFIHYIGHIKKHDSVGLAITTTEGANLYTYNKDDKSIGPPQAFSEHEKKIILLLASGHDTKEIAQKLFISPHTVDTHRRNFIKKTDCIDTTGVVDFAKLINLI